MTFYDYIGVACVAGIATFYAAAAVFHACVLWLLERGRK